MQRIAVQRPVLTLVVFLAIVVLGILALLNLPIDLMPNVSLPTASVVTLYPGASSEDVEKKVTDILEEAIATVPNVKEITSTSFENVSTIVVSFNWGTNLDAAINDLRDRLDLARRRLPEDAEDPYIFKFDLSQWPVLVVAATSDDPTLDVRKIVEDEVVEELRHGRGVGAVQIWGGGRKRVIHIWVDKDRLEALHLPLETLIAVLAQENVNIPAGNLAAGKTSYLIRVPQEFVTASELENLPILEVEGRLIRLKDVARVEDGYAEPQNYVRVNGKPGVFFAVQKTSGANTVEVAREARKRLQTVEERIPGLHLQVVIDGSLFIRNSIRNLATTILWALVLVVFVTLLFLRNLRGSLIIASVIPVSLITAFIFLYLIGASINIISLSSLAIAIGMVVDNAVVVLENIYYHRERGETRREAAVFGTGEVSGAITASTLTTVAILVPIVVIQGFVGIMFRQLATSVILVLFASLFAALTLTPMLASKYIRILRGGRFARIHEGFFRALDRFYAATLRFALRWKAWVILGGLALFIASFGLLRQIPTEFIPPSDTGDFRGQFQLPTGTRLEVTDSVMRLLEQKMRRMIPEAEVIVTRSGPSETGMGAVFGAKESSNSGFFSGHLKPRSQRKRSVFDIVAQLNDTLARFPALESYTVAASGGGQEFLFGTGKPIEIEIYGYDLALTDSLARLVRQILQKIPGIKAPTISRSSRRPEIWVRLNRDRLYRYGLSSSRVGTYLRTALYGTDATTLKRGGDEYPIRIHLENRDRKDPHILESLRIPTPQGPVYLADLATLERHLGPLSLEHKNRERVVRVQAETYGRPLGAIAHDVDQAIRRLPLPPGVRIEIAGTIKRQRESFGTLFKALLGGTLLVYLVMAGLFESFLVPLLIMFSVPFAFTGSFLILYLTGTPLSMMAFVGMLMLVGVVVNNAIVLLDYIGLLRARGLSLTEAVVEGGRRRLRPVLITALTTVFGMVPLAISHAEGAEMWSPFGIVVIGGLLFSTLITLVYIPTLYAWVASWRRKGG